MGFLKDLFKLLIEIVTLGGAGRLEDAKRGYEEANARLQSLIGRANACKKRINAAVVAIGSALRRTKPHLESAERMLKCRIENQRALDVAVTTQTLHKMERFNAGMNSALTVGVGTLTGGTMAVGAWSLVTLFGSASTGAAISGLSGVAATNATLAWFGGGALAAGGAGMAGGMAVLGGIAAVPLVYFTHKKAGALENAKVKVEESIAAVLRELESLPLRVKVVEARQREAERHCNEIIATITRLRRVIRPYGMFNVAKEKLLSMLGKQPYTKAQLDAMTELTEALAIFLAAFDGHACGAASGTQGKSN
ncbi:hypothetical protein [Inhella gelatinilytica]|uniref:Uncharacterized protein n=1 Tax=Inhella gelatinilytica TaxID=2795030 RepID=A0A931IW66_9BURK|nr:hypothetical protein [Inhella gelatinilytica]MBH9553960.1 hypothetical protein [Inhella gelatinilytica]